VSGLVDWWTEPVARGRIAALRLLAYGYVLIDVFLTADWVTRHANGPTQFYRPLQVARLLSLPIPTHQFVLSVRALLVIVTVAALSGRWPRLLGAAVAVLYAQWMVIAMSYGKVDHDRFAFMVLLFVLPTVGSARLGDEAPSAEVGWAVRMVQVSVVATYFLAAVAKLRFGGLDWLTGSTLAWAIVRRGTLFSNWLLHAPWLLRALQWFIVTLELCSPAIFLVRRERTRVIVVAALVGFHLVTFAAIGIIFLPHLVAMTAFLPLERLSRGGYARSASTGDAEAELTNSVRVTNR